MNGWLLMHHVYHGVNIQYGVQVIADDQGEKEMLGCL